MSLATLNTPLSINAGTASSTPAPSTFAALPNTGAASSSIPRQARMRSKLRSAASASSETGSGSPRDVTEPDRFGSALADGRCARPSGPLLGAALGPASKPDSLGPQIPRPLLACFRTQMGQKWSGSRTQRTGLGSAATGPGSRGLVGDTQAPGDPAGLRGVGQEVWTRSSVSGPSGPSRRWPAPVEQRAGQRHARGRSLLARN
jgi:hypothetical protein